jgi:hypothetical protein
MKCEICGRDFLSKCSLGKHLTRTHKENIKQYYDNFLRKENEGHCLNCGTETSFYNLCGYLKFCSCKCAATFKDTKRKREETCKEKYGKRNVFQIDKIKKQIKETCIEKYGVENPSKSKIIIERIKQTFQENYKDGHPMRDKKITDKLKQQWMQKYGVDSPLKVTAIAKKIKDSMIKKYGCLYKQTEKARNEMIEWQAAYMNRFIKNPSKQQVKLFNIVQQVCPYVILNYPCAGFSIDIAISKLSLAIEYDCSYWHKDKQKDERRQKILENEGWLFLRYKDKIPTKQELLKEINDILGGIKQ